MSLLKKWDVHELTREERYRAVTRGIFLSYVCGYLSYVFIVSLVLYPYKNAEFEGFFFMKYLAAPLLFLGGAYPFMRSFFSLAILADIVSKAELENKPESAK